MALSSAALATGAFCPHGDFEIAGAASGPLKGLTFATKDIFDIAGRVTGCGNPDWLASHGPASATAPAAQKLLDAGASMIGKTITDELAFSLNGQNFHYGTPRNALTPERIPGGSSCGSVSAVAHGTVDLALGSDTGGSVRIPACLNGMFGIRSTHGAVDISGVMPLAPSFDTVGWFARDAHTLYRAGEVLLPADRSGIALSRFYVIRDAFALAEPSVANAVRQALSRAAGTLSIAAELDLASELGGLGEWLKRFRRLQPREIWAIHGAWIESTKPKFGPEIAERFALAKSVAEAPEGDDQEFRTKVSAHLDRVLGPDGVLLIPTAGTIAPRLDASKEELADFRDRTLSLTSIAGLGGLPQVQIPAGLVGGAAVGLSLIGPRGSDRALLRLTEQVARALA
ncbi:amidase [Dongia deserti]|uniref:amidase n=1 Tax=Dongia deserti TaxID=2268030 RepID=UPI000E64D85B|nr:amidase [Dongia deserti]